MNIKILGLALASLLSLGEAKQYNFNVVSILGKGYTLGVRVGNQEQKLTSTDFPLFTGSINANNDKYRYIAYDGQNKVVAEEEFERTYTNETPNINEVFNRIDKKIEVPSLPEPFKPMFKMGTKNYQPFPKDVIYNFYAECDAKVYKDITDRPFLSEEDTNDTLANCTTINIISPTGTFKTTGAIKLLGYGSRLYKKLSWSVKLDNKFLGRKAIKLRAMANDPTLVREKLATELYRAVGVPVQEGAYARVFINGDIYGLYTLCDSFSSKWIANYIHGNNKAKVGYSYKLISSHPEGPYADLKYIGDDYNAYLEKNTYEVDEYEKSAVNANDLAGQWKPLIEFTKKYDNWVKTYGNDNSDQAINELKSFFNIESVLRTMAIDTLILGLDNFFYVMSNAQLYYNPERQNYQILPYDFDESLSGDKDDSLIDNEHYMDDCITWVNHREDIFDHYFTNNLLKHPQIKERYDVILGKVTREVFIKDAVSPFIHSAADLIKDDIKWNFEAIDKLNIGYEDGNVNHFTYEEFESNLDYTPVDWNGDINNDDAPFGILEWVDKRGESCRKYTNKVDISKNVNISDDVDLDSAANPKAVYSILLLTILYVFYFAF